MNFRSSLAAFAFALVACGGSAHQLDPSLHPIHERFDSGEVLPGDDGGIDSGTPDAGSDAGTPDDGGTVGPTVISISPLSAIESETHLISSPDGVVAVAWISISPTGNSTNGYRFSRDRGAHWEAVADVAAPGGRVASDPVLAVDSQSNFYMTFIGFKVDSTGNPSDMHVYVSKAPAGTTTFGAPVEATQNVAAADQFDKPWITVLPGDVILVTYAKTSTGGIYSARSADFGQTWSNQVIVEDGSFRNLVFPCFPPGGTRTYVTYHAGGGIGLRWSDDRGLTWPVTNATALEVSGNQPAFDDPTCTASGTEVWAAWGLTTDQASSASSPKLTTLRVAHSNDSGATVDRRLNFQDSAATFMMHPYLGREATGALDLVYYAGNSDGDTAGSFRRARSVDGAQTFAFTAAVDTPLTYLQARSDPRWLGDYPGLDLRSGMLFTAFVNNTSGRAHIAFYRTPVP